MNKIEKLLLIVVFLTITLLPKTAVARPIHITDCTPLPTTVYTNEIQYGEYSLEARPGLPIVPYNQLPPMVQQVAEPSAEYCNPIRTIMSPIGMCKVKLKLTAPTYPGTINTEIAACVEGSRSSCTKHKISVQVVGTPIIFTTKAEPFPQMYYDETQILKYEIKNISPATKTFKIEGITDPIERNHDIPNDCKNSLEAGGTCSIELVIAPKKAGNISQKLKIVDSIGVAASTLIEIAVLD